MRSLACASSVSLSFHGEQRTNYRSLALQCPMLVRDLCLAESEGLILDHCLCTGLHYFSDCPSCVSAIRSTLEPFTSSESPRILDLQISYLDHIVSFRIPGLLSSRKLPLLVQIENLIRSQGFDVERTTPVPAALPTKRHVIPRLIDGDGSGSFWARVGWPGKKEKEANERRRRHMESCAECRRNEAAQVAALDGAHSELTSAPEALSVHIDKPALPKLVESKLSVEGMFCG